MYKISVPVMNSTIHANNRNTYRSMFQRAGASRIFLALEEQFIPDTLHENITYFKDNGFEVGVWIGTIGHGSVLNHVDGLNVDIPYTQMVDIEGITRSFANCPLDETFVEDISQFVASIAKLGPDIVMLDDDFRLSQHGPHICCACSKHLARISDILGETITREQLKPYVLTGKPNRYRDAWLQAQNESLQSLAKRIRDEVDKETPHVRVCNCIGYAPWDVDGIDIPRLSRTLAGNHPPILRLTGAPYWATKSRKFPLITVFEIARMLASFVRDEGIELMSEGDVYPRPRYTCPASYLELYDIATRIDGNYDGILKYMFDYVAGPDFEPGYLMMHEENQSFYDWISSTFPNGANAGIKVVTRSGAMKDADLDLSPQKLLSPLPQDGAIFGHCGIPTIYHGTGICNSVFGENARTLDLAELKNGTIIDATAAIILTQHGVDVGLESYNSFSEKTIGFLYTANPEHKTPITDGQVRVLDATTKETVRPLLFYSAKEKPIAYCYENKNGERFLVFLFEGASMYDFSSRIGISGINKNYAMQEVLVDTIPWVARKPLPAYCSKNPELYVMCEQGESYTSVALFNCFADPVLHPTVKLDKSYTHIECMNCTASLDGDTVTLTSRLHAYSAVAFRVYN